MKLKFQHQKNVKINLKCDKTRAPASKPCFVDVKILFVAFRFNEGGETKTSGIVKDLKTKQKEHEAIISSYQISIKFNFFIRRFWMQHGKLRRWQSFSIQKLFKWTTIDWHCIADVSTEIYLRFLSFHPSHEGITAHRVKASNKIHKNRNSKNFTLIS